MKYKSCEHLQAITTVKKGSNICSACAETGDTWLHLRVCQSCGITLCCDSSPNKHMTAHMQHSGHTVISSGEPGEYWLYCYPHQLFKPLEV